MFAFDGDFKSKRSINLGGSKKAAIDKNELLKKTQVERMEREMDRSKIKAAMNIQRIWRRYKVRNQLKTHFIQSNTNQDWNLLSSDEILNKIHQCLLFFKNTNDIPPNIHESLCGQVITRYQSFIPLDTNKRDIKATEWILSSFTMRVIQHFDISQWSDLDYRYFNMLFELDSNLRKLIHLESRPDIQKLLVNCLIKKIKTLPQPQLISALALCEKSIDNSILDWSCTNLNFIESLMDTEIQDYSPFYPLFQRLFSRSLLNNLIQNRSSNTVDNIKLLYRIKNLTHLHQTDFIQISKDKKIKLFSLICETLLLLDPQFIQSMQPTINEDEEDNNDSNIIQNSILSTNYRNIDQRQLIDDLKTPTFLFQFSRLISSYTENQDLSISALDALVFLLFIFPEETTRIVSFLLSHTEQEIFSPLIKVVFSRTAHVNELMSSEEVSQYLQTGPISPLILLSSLFSRYLLTLGIDEPLPEGINIDDMRNLGLLMKDILMGRSSYTTTNFITARLSKTLRQIYEKDCRRNFFKEGYWLIEGIDLQLFDDSIGFTNEENNFLPAGRSSQASVFKSCQRILEEMPYVLPFFVRAHFFRRWIDRDRLKQGYDPVFRIARATIHRNSIFEDGFTQLNKLGSGLKHRVAITFIDKDGLREVGIDGGGVFKEFLTSLTSLTFNENYGIFKATSERLLYPSPESYAKSNSQLASMEFLGRVLGKALYDGILVDADFAGFFLAKWLGRLSHLDDLPSLDKELYNGLMFVKNYRGNVEEDLGLNFALTVNEFGEQSQIELIPGGSTIPVTNINRLQYVFMVAHYKLNLQIQKQCAAFFSGLKDLINPEWLQIFNQNELQMIIGGVSKKIDMNDFKSAVSYLGEFNESHPTIKFFWQIVEEEFSEEDRSNLIKFVTSCAKPPLLGFKELDPSFAIRSAGDDESRLPTASTCVNLLKMPVYKSKEVLKQKFLYVINANAGFDLS